MRRSVTLVSVLVMVLALLPMPARAATPNCALCILEFQVQGQQGEEDQDFVVIANMSANKITASSIQLRYYNSEGVLGESLGVGTFEIGQIKVYASDSLRALNTSATKLTLPLYSSGGSLQIARTSGATTTVYDKVGWGNTTLFEGNALGQVSAGVTIARHNLSGMVQDTDNNSADFQLKPVDCVGADISEIQPFVTDEMGQTVDAWVELTGTVTQSGDCVLVTASGNTYSIAAADMPNGGEIAIITEAITEQGNTVPLELGIPTGQIWLASTSTYTDASGKSLHLPSATQSYSTLTKGQSWAIVDGIWRRTFQPTKGSVPNVFQASVTAFDDDPTACESIRISELLPNPVGDDTDREWIELTNQSDQAVSLAHCVVNLDGTAYYFLPDDVLGPGEWRTMTEAYSSEQESKPFSLRNSGENAVMMQRLRADGGTETVQSFVYTDAPEGSSYARFDDGWRWLTVPTPNLDNAAVPSSEEAGPTEFPAEQPEASESNSSAPNAPLIITELLPNPSAPQTDDADEYIEIYNPTDDTVDLADYVLRTGNSYSYSYTFTDETISALGYLIVKSGDTSLSLSNTAGRAQLRGPNGQVVSETIPYIDAPEGQSWALIDGTWQWTASTTPAAGNILTAPILASLAKAGATKKATTAKAAKSKAAAKPKAAKPAAKKSAKTNATAAAATTKPAAAPLHILVILTVGLMALGYAIFEYRNDIANRFYKLKQRFGK